MKKLVVIIGMHRCGTSLLASCLERLGCSIGRTKNKDKNWQNPRGYWENDAFTKFHNRILAANGVRPFSVREVGQYTEAQLTLYENLLKTEFVNDSLMLIKDPRLTFFVDFLREIADRMQLDLRILFASRAIEECTQSLVKAHRRATPQVARTLYEASHKQFVAGEMLMVKYNRVLDDCSSVLREVSDFCDLEYRDCSELIDDTLYRERFVVDMTPVSKCPYRSPMAVSEAIAPIIKGKLVCELGCAEGDNMVFMSRFAKKVIGLEVKGERRQHAEKRGLDVVSGNYFSDDIDLPEAEVYYCWPNNPADHEPLVKRIYSNSAWEGTIIIAGELGYRNESELIGQCAKKWGGTLMEVDFHEGDDERENGTFLLGVITKYSDKADKVDVVKNISEVDVVKNISERKGADNQSITLNMIVKDEAHCIHTSLNTIYKYIDYYVIVDTGSTDHTQDVIKEFFDCHGIPGEIHDVPWKNFGWNRTEACKLAKGKGDYTWVIDADDEICGDLVLPDRLTKDMYNLFYNSALSGGEGWWRPQLFNNSLDWRYEGVLHEYATCDEAVTHERIEGNYCVKPTFAGDRNKDGTEAKMKRDIALMRKALEEEPDNVRYMFYLAQAYHTVGDYSQAIEWFSKRVKAGGWGEEVYISLLRKAECYGVVKGEVPFGLLIEAYEYRPQRFEAPFAIIKACRESDKFHSGYAWAKTLIDKPAPAEDNLFVNTAITTWRIQDELSICAYYVGHYSESKDLCSSLLANKALPVSEQGRISSNLKFALDKLGE